MTMNYTARNVAASIPLTQNTAPVFEHNCLYTHDIRRKNTKRWQDGFLRFHTFNNRVMVYDTSRNFIGDTHYQDAGSNGVEDGDELTLERNGILVQVGEKLATQETDLSELLAKRTPKTLDDRDKRQSDISTSGTQSYLQPRPSDTIPKTPTQSTGWAARARIPRESPYEQREAAVAPEDHWEHGRVTKRQRVDDEHVPLWQILKTSKAPRHKPSASKAPVTPMWARTADARANGRGSSTKTAVKSNEITKQGRLKVKEVIEIDSSAEAPQEVVDRNLQGGHVQLQPRRAIYNSSSPARGLTKSPVTQSKNARIHTAPDRPATIGRPAIAQVTPLQEIQDPEKQKNSVYKPGPAQSPAKAQDQAEAQTPSKSPPVSTTTHLPKVTEDFPADLIKDKALDLIATKHSWPDRPTKPLRLASSAPRKILLCQTLALPKSSGPFDPRNLHSANEVPLNEAATSAANEISKKWSKDGRREHMTGSTGKIEDIDSTPAFEVMEERPRLSLQLAKPGLRRPKVRDTTSVPSEAIPQTKQPSPPLQDNPQQTFRHDPPDYSHLDAQLLPTSKPSIPFNAQAKVNAQPIAQTSAPKAALPNRAGPPLFQTSSSKNTVITRADTKSSINRPFRRVLSDTTNLSPAKRRPPPLKGGLQRAETVIGVPAVHGIRNVAQQNVRNRERDDGGCQGKTVDVASLMDQGPWTREAWDLLGWCPPGKELGWNYGATGALAGG